MISERKTESINFDDIILLPKYSAIDSRNDVVVHSMDINHIPIFSAPMKNISEPDLVIEIGRLGGMGILHRYFKDQIKRNYAVLKISDSGVPFGVSIGIRDLDEELDYVAFCVGEGASDVVVDVASGYLRKTYDAVKKLKDFRNIHKLNFNIISGNIVDFAGAILLAEAGTDFIRVGIGGGSLCLTSKSIGIGSPALTAISDCAKIKEIYPNIKLIMDGGIRNPGDALKALCFGADAVMIGGLFGRAKEAGNNGEIYGMSSFKLQKIMGKQLESNEGVEIKIPDEEIRSFEDIFNEFVFGLKSGLSYLGCENIDWLNITKVEYIRV